MLLAARSMTSASNAQPLRRLRRLRSRPRRKPAQLAVGVRPAATSRWGTRPPWRGLVSRPALGELASAFRDLVCAAAQTAVGAVVLRGADGTDPRLASSSTRLLDMRGLMRRVDRRDVRRRDRR